MAKTFTQQIGMPGTNLYLDAEGLHNFLFHDGIKGLNNMGAMCNNFAHYAQSTAAGFVSRSYTGTGREMFMAQFPVYCPPWAYRMLWTAGVERSAGTVTATTVYFCAGKPYTGPDPDTEAAFDPTDIPGSVSHSSTFSLSSGYLLVDDSTTGIAALPLPHMGTWVRMLGFVIITVTGGTNASFKLRDFTCWFSPQ